MQTTKRRGRPRGKRRDESDSDEEYLEFRRLLREVLILLEICRTKSRKSSVSLIPGDAQRHHQTLHQHFVKPDFIKEAHEGSYAIRIDIKYAWWVRGMEHEETPIATETIKTMRIKSFWMNHTTPHPASTWRMRRLHSPGSHMLLICIPIFNPPLHNAAVGGYGDVVNIFILDCKKKKKSVSFCLSPCRCFEAFPATSNQLKYAPNIEFHAHLIVKSAE
jgi:hypothetical protein